MQLHCRLVTDALVVIAAHTEAEARTLATDAYGEGVVVLNYEGPLDVSQLVGQAAPDMPLADVKAGLKARVDERAETLRLGLITPGAGQAMEYQETQAQAAAALKAPSSATPAKYPMLAASIGIDIDPTTNAPASDVLGVARSIDAARGLWLAAGSAIRGARLETKRAIDDAGTLDAVLMAFARPWPQPGGASEASPSP